MGKWLEEFERQQAEEAARLAAAKAKKRRRAIVLGAILVVLLLTAVVLSLFRANMLCIHEWEDPTCDTPSTCAICGDVTGESLGHSWLDASCTEASTCSVCGEAQGEPLGHEVEESTWETVTEPTCEEPGEESAPCFVCGFLETREVEPLGHEEGEWKVSKKSVIKNGKVIPGLKVLICERCGKKLESKEYERSMPAEESSSNSGGSSGYGGFVSDYGSGSSGGSGGWHDSESNATTVYTTDTGEKYHLEWCSSLRQSRHATTVASAKSRGYEPCKRCDPPS